MNSSANKMEVLKMEYTQVCNKLLYLDDQANKYVSYMLTTIAALAAFLQFLVKDGGISDYINFSLLISAGTLMSIPSEEFIPLTRIQCKIHLLYYSIQQKSSHEVTQRLNKVERSFDVRK